MPNADSVLYKIALTVDGDQVRVTHTTDPDLAVSYLRDAIEDPSVTDITVEKSAQNDSSGAS